MTEEEFRIILTTICEQLTMEMRKHGFATAKDFENRVRTLVHDVIADPSLQINPTPSAQAFPDIAVRQFGIEVKFTSNDTWLSIANSVLETNRIATVEKVFVVFGKMGGKPEVRWCRYEDCVVHVRTSHVISPKRSRHLKCRFVYSAVSTCNFTPPAPTRQYFLSTGL
ncbi:MAG: hypothetical protein ORN29_07870 [Rhodoferax sp.]|nr:hypothetical protein [Rhodoferax sp.]